MDKLKFSKMHGNGNDFVLINALKMGPQVLSRIKRRIKLLSDRRFGVGADQVLLVLPSKKDFQC